MLTEYVVIHHRLLGQFQQLVTRNLADGWELAGGVFFAHDEFHQPLLRRRPADVAENR